MLNLRSNVSIQVNEKIYLKDPLSSELGKKILATGIDMIDEMGFEHFTFRKQSKSLHNLVFEVMGCPVPETMRTAC